MIVFCFYLQQDIDQTPKNKMFEISFLRVTRDDNFKQWEMPFHLQKIFSKNIYYGEDVNFEQVKLPQDEILFLHSTIQHAKVFHNSEIINQWPVFRHLKKRRLTAEQLSNQRNKMTLVKLDYITSNTTSHSEKQYSKFDITSMKNEPIYSSLIHYGSAAEKLHQHPSLLIGFGWRYNRSFATLDDNEFILQTGNVYKYFELLITEIHPSFLEIFDRLNQGNI